MNQAVDTAITFSVRFANSYIGGEMWIAWARWVGLQGDKPDDKVPYAIAALGRYCGALAACVSGCSLRCLLATGFWLLTAPLTVQGKKKKKKKRN